MPTDQLAGEFQNICRGTVDRPVGTALVCWHGCKIGQCLERTMDWSMIGEQDIKGYHDRFVVDDALEQFWLDAPEPTLS